MVDYERRGDIIYINCRNWIIPPSIEDSGATLAIVLDILSKEPNVNRIILSEFKENEYDPQQVRLLYSLVNLYNDLLFKEKLLELSEFAKCKNLTRFLHDFRILLMEGLRKDPIASYFKLLMMERILSRKKDECSLKFLERVKKAKTLMENSLFFQHAKKYFKYFKLGSREVYRKIFNSISRPRFISTLFNFSIPPNAALVDKYEVSNSQIQIFKIPGKIRYLYYVYPAEFNLLDIEIAIIEEARNRLSGMEVEIDYKDFERARANFIQTAKNLIREIAANYGYRLSYERLEELANILTRYTIGFGVLEILLADERLQDVYVNSPVGEVPIFVNHSDFEECETNMIPSLEDAESWATRFRLYSGRPLDEANPVLDTEIIVPGGRARVAAITKSLSPEGLAFAFRRHREKPWTFPLFIKYKMFNPLFAGVMSFIVDGGRSILVAGGRGSGKTSVLTSLILEIMRRYRILVQEDTLEIPVPQIRKLGYNIERLKSRSVITRVESELPAEEVLRTALRLGDSALIIGEVRSSEALALFEAMRIGALANVVAGTIHGESAYGVFDRVVHDLGVPKTSFKAIDLIMICNKLRTPDGLHTFRRVVELVEVRKNWVEDPEEEGGFVKLFEYSAKEDSLKPTDTLIYGESFILNEIAKRVKEWRGNWDRVWDNILLRAKIKETLVEFAEKLGRSEILEGPWVVASNEMFHSISESVREEVGYVDSKLVFERWLNWFKNQLKS